MTRAVTVAQYGSGADGSANLDIDASTLFIDSVNARVGIGTSTPSNRLDIKAATNNSDTVLVRAANNNNFFTIKPENTTSSVEIGYWASSAWGNTQVSGNIVSFNVATGIGIGTTPTYKLEVSGATRSGFFNSNTTQATPMGFVAINSSGTGDGSLAGYSLWCNGTYATHIHLRADGYLGAGGWSASAWRWYCNMATGDFTASGNLAAYSDPRLKEDVKPIESALDKVFKLNGVRFRWKNDSILGHPGQYDYGVLANEVQEVLPELVSDSIAESPDGDRYKTVAYDKLVPVLIEAIKEQQKQIDALRNELNGLKICSCP